MPPRESSAREPASVATVIATSRSAPGLGRASKRPWAVAVDEVNTPRAYLRGRRRESPRGGIRLHAMGTHKFPSQGVSPPPGPP
jgi:hypothetical protein